MFFEIESLKNTIEEMEWNHDLELDKQYDEEWNELEKELEKAKSEIALLKFVQPVTTLSGLDGLDFKQDTIDELTTFFQSNNN